MLVSEHKVNRLYCRLIEQLFLPDVKKVVMYRVLNVLFVKEHVPIQRKSDVSINMMETTLNYWSI